MGLAVRLWVLGAVVPFVGLVLAITLGAQFIHAHLEESLDGALLEQAAVEAVSLFDGPGGRVHLHAAYSPLRHSVQRVNPAAAVYDRVGRAVVRARSGDGLDATDPELLPADVPEVPVLATRAGPDGRSVRVLSVAVKDEAGTPYALQLAASLGPLEATTSLFRRVGMGLALALGLGLLALQTLHARRLSSRVRALTTHVAALREGDLSAVPPAPRGGDEIAELSRVVAEATARLRLARDAQDRLVADAAHELRTPLTFIRTSIDLALRRRREVPELIAALDETRREVDRLARLSTRLLDLAAAGRGRWDRTPADLRRTADEAAEAIRAEAEERGVLVEVRGPQSVPASFDPAGIRQAVDNLLANAVRYSPRGEKVTVDVGRLDGVARLVVRDGGPGIPDAERERVFEPFHRVGGPAGTGAGAGLGLAIVREIASGHGGRVFAAPSARGAELVLELPTTLATPPVP